MALIVVSGASSGIGAATVRRLARAGTTLVLVARREERLEALAEEVRAAGGQAVVEALDAADGDAVVAMAARITTSHGAPDAVIHCAGAGRWLYVEDTEPSEAAEMIGAPYLAAFHLDHAFLPGMLEAGAGVLVHVNSPACLMPWPHSAGYTASRWALRGLHEALVQDLAGTGVKTSHVVFGEVSSEYFDANAGVRDHLPGIARMIPVSTPEACARVLERVLRRRPRQLVYPFVLRTFHWSNQVTPGLVRWLVRTTGTRR